jgi:hypothetical protein
VGAIGADQDAAFEGLAVTFDVGDGADVVVGLFDREDAGPEAEVNQSGAFRFG